MRDVPRPVLVCAARVPKMGRGPALTRRSAPPAITARPKNKMESAEDEEERTRRAQRTKRGRGMAVKQGDGGEAGGRSWAMFLELCVGTCGGQTCPKFLIQVVQRGVMSHGLRGWAKSASGSPALLALALKRKSDAARGGRRSVLGMPAEV